MKKLHVGFDTEDDKGTMTIFAWTHAPRVQEYRMADLSTQDEFIRDLARMSKNTQVCVWMINISYDLVNFFGENMPSVLKLYMARKKIVGATLKGHKNVNFYAVDRFLPKMSASAIGKSIDCPKLELGFDDPKRCVRDALIAQKAGEKITQTLDRLGIPLKFSPVSGALFAIEAEMGSRLPLARTWVREAGQSALYGARTETVFRGEVVSKPGANLHYFDFNQQYGRAMLDTIPDYSVCDEAREPTEPDFIADVTVRVTGKNGMAPLPYHHEEAGLIFPTGTFRNVWTSEDLSLPGVEILKYHRTYSFPYRGAYLAPLVKKLIPKDRDTVITKAIKKNLYTGLSGKWSQQNQWTFFTHWEKALPKDYWNGVNLGDYILAQREGDFPRWSNFVWSAFIQSKARRWLWELYESIWKEGGQVLYTDTDSALCTLANTINASRILDRMSGRLKHKTIHKANVFGPKVYLFQDRRGNVISLSAKGIPGKLHENIVQGEVEFEGEIPDSFFSLLRSKEITEEQGFKNRWANKKFRLAKSFRNRVPIGRDKTWTRPLRLENGIVV